ncbi:MAG: hypothetical protein HY860_01505 [Chlamydiales bacterium]|nr:hypothetical protein [Chlamydiales bacterium]
MIVTPANQPLCDALTFWNDNKLLARKLVVDPFPPKNGRGSLWKGDFIDPSKIALLNLIVMPMAAIETISRIAISILCFPLVFIKPDTFLKEFIYTPIVGIWDVTLIAPLCVVLFTAVTVVRIFNN